MNIVLDEAFEEKDGGEKVPMGMCVRTIFQQPSSALPRVRLTASTTVHPRQLTDHDRGP
jgi:hypothetical protein